MYTFPSIACVRLRRDRRRPGGGRGRCGAAESLQPRGCGSWGNPLGNGSLENAGLPDGKCKHHYVKL